VAMANKFHEVAHECDFERFLKLVMTDAPSV
jgi:hypothetical protein